MKRDGAEQIAVEDTIRTACCSWLLGHAFEGKKVCVCFLVLSYTGSELRAELYAE